MAATSNLRLLVSADIGAAAGQLNRLESQVKGFGTGVGGAVTKTDQLKANLDKAAPAGFALTAIGGAITAGMGGAVKTAIDFQAAMSGIKAVMDPADVAAFGSAIEDLALKLGADTSFSASEAASAIEELVKAGIPAEAILAGVAKNALDLAAATGIDTASAAEIAANAMNAFQVDAADMGHVMDFLAGTSNATAADMMDLKFGLAAVGGVARLAGLSFEDTTTALGYFVNQGLSGQDAGTSLKTMLMRLNPQTDKAANLMKELGIITEESGNRFYDAAGNLKSLEEIAGVLRDVTGGMSEMERADVLGKLFGSDAVRAGAFLALSDPGTFTELQKQIGEMSVADMAALRLDNLAGAIEQLTGSIETLAIKIGGRLIPFLRPVVEFLTKLANAFSSLPPEVQTIIAVLAALAGVGALLLGGLILLAPAIVALPAAFAALGAAAGIAGGAIAALALPVLAIIAVVALLYLAWTNNWLGIRDVTASAVSWIGDRLHELGGTIRTAVGLFHALAFGDMSLMDTSDITGIYEDSAVMTGIWAIRDAAERIGRDIPLLLFDPGRAVAQAFGPEIVAALGGIVTSALTLGQQLGQSIWAGIQGVFAGGGAAGGPGLLAPLLESLNTALVGALNALNVALTGALAGATAILTGLVAGLLAAFQPLGTYISTVLVPFVLALSNAVGALGNLGFRLVIAVGNTLVSVFEMIGNAVSGVLLPIFTGLASFLGTTFLAAWTAVSGFVSGTWTQAMTGANTFVAGTLSPTLTALSTFLSTTLLAAWTAVSSFVSTTFQSALGALNTFVTGTLTPTLTTLSNFLTVTLVGAWRSVSDFVSGAFTTALSAVHTFITGTVGPALDWFANTILSAVTRGFEGITSAIQTVTGWLNTLAATLNSIQIPANFLPGSPTPFEMGMWGIAEATAAANRQMALLGSGLPHGPALGVGALPAGTAGTGTATLAPVAPVVVNIHPGAIVTSGGRPEFARMIGDAIAALVQTMAEAEEKAALSASSTLPGAVY